MLNYKNMVKDEILVNTAQIEQYYINSIKQKHALKFGLEYERISIDLSNGKNAQYKYIEKIIKDFASMLNWGLLYDNKTLIGTISKDGTTISLEPGCQMELSLAPKDSICEIEKSAKEILNVLDRIAKFYNVAFLPLGLTPKSTHQNIELLNKERYKIMAKSLIKNGKFIPNMMRETAGVQVNIDYCSEYDAFKKLKVLNLISPCLTGFFANSPIRNNKLTQYKSYRALAWKFSGACRCGIFYKNIFKKENPKFLDYINEILAVPMVFIEKNNEKIIFNGTTFGEYINSKKACLKDYILHSSLTFPDVRLKNCIEIRNHDSQDFKMTMCICALYKGILNSNLDEIEKDFAEFNFDDIEKMGFLSAKFGVDYIYKNFSPKNYIKKLFKIAQENLDENEKQYLSTTNYYLEHGICVADKIINNNIKSADELIKHVLG